MVNYHQVGRMKRSRFTEEQIVKILKHQENGLKVAEIYCQNTFIVFYARHG